LQSLTEGNPSLEERVRRLRGLGNRVLESSESTRRWGTSGGTMDTNMMQFRKDVSEAYAPFEQELELISKDAKQSQDTTRSAERESRARIQQFLMAIVAFNVVLTIFLALFFSKGITRRLGVLTENARRLAKRETLIAPVTGADEIARLDK